MRRSLLLLPVCLAVAALAGCGLKGPLVMPPAKPASAPAPAMPAPASSALPAPTPTGTAMPSAPAGTATLPATER
jgi:predicted small lipoprotein YifL